MKLTSAFVALSVLLATPALAQDIPPPNDIPAPPGMNDPGVRATEPARGSTSLQPVKPAPIVSGQPLPQVTVRKQGEDTVQEYRRNGQLYMVVVTPPNGVAQTYMVDPGGRLVDEHGQKPVRPVMYKVMEWGKSKPAPSDSSESSDTGD